MLELLEKRRPSFDMANASQRNNIMDIRKSIELIDHTQIHAMVNLAKGRCRGIIKEHPGTPWATSAEWEMNVPFGFGKREYYAKPRKTPALPVPPATGGPTPQRL